MTFAAAALASAGFNWTPVLGIVGIITVLFAAAAVAGGQFRISRNTQIVANYREAAQSWEAKADAQADELAELKTQLGEKDKRIDDLQQQVTELRGHMAALQDMMVGAAALDTIRTLVTSARDDILAAIAGGK